MNGALLEQMQNDARTIVKTDFNTTVEITDKNGKTESIEGLATLHHSTFDPEAGGTVSGRNAHICVSIKDLEEAGFNLYENTKADYINMKGWKVSFEFGGKTWQFLCEDVRPSQTFGLIVMYNLGALK